MSIPNSSTVDTNSFDSALEVESIPGDAYSDALPAERQTSATNLSYAPVAQYFGYDRPDQEETFQLQYIYDYFARENSTRGEIVNAMREVERTLTQPEVGQSRLNKLYTYVRVLANIADAELEKKAYLK